MPEPFKNQLNAELINQMTWHLERAARGGAEAFDADCFRRLALDGLDALELKQRVEHIRKALTASLPPTFAEAAAVIEAALAPLSDSCAPWDLRSSSSGLSGWAVWPLTDYVAHAGLDHAERALQALYALTQRSTAEFALRPFLQRHPELTLHTLALWVRDESEHVRRLVSEGSRPRLPWGLRLQAFVADPSPCLPLLDQLYQDPSEYVRRSVANHLNDISKDHPALAVSIAERWLAAGSETTRRLVRHALRSLVKQGHAGALALLGFVSNDQVRIIRLALDSNQIAAGGTLRFRAEISNNGPHDTLLCVDYVIHHRKANGTLRPKVFKLTTARLAPGATLQLDKQHSFRTITTRRYHAGQHGVEILVNGRALAHKTFELLAESG